jgi:hypothetical protein
MSEACRFVNIKVWFSFSSEHLGIQRIVAARFANLYIYYVINDFAFISIATRLPPSTANAQNPTLLRVWPLTEKHFCNFLQTRIPVYKSSFFPFLRNTNCIWHAMAFCAVT